MSPCVEFIQDDWGDGYDVPTYATLLRCPNPKCRAWLPRDFPVGSQFKCKKCGSVLETIPNTDNIEEEEEEMDDDEIYEYYGGKICLVPEYAVKDE